MRNVSDKSCKENQNTHFIQKYANNQQMRFNIYDVFYSQYSHPIVVNCVFFSCYGCVGDSYPHFYSCNKNIALKMAAIPAETCW